MAKTDVGTDGVVALIKFFSEKSHYLAFRDGISLFRTPHFFRLRDDAGRSDRRESCAGYYDRTIGDEIPNIVVDGKVVDATSLKSVLIYPVTEQEDSWLQSWSVVGPSNDFEQSLDRMLAEFGTYFVVLPAANIDAYARLISQASGDVVRYGRIKYSDNPMDGSLTVKDAQFAYQTEFRFYVGQCEKCEVDDKKLLLSGVDRILTHADSLKFVSPAGMVKYCTLGQLKVVCSGAPNVTDAGADRKNDLDINRRGR